MTIPVNHHYELASDVLSDVEENILEKIPPESIEKMSFSEAFEVNNFLIQTAHTHALLAIVEELRRTNNRYS